jgi:hypothetical protein
MDEIGLLDDNWLIGRFLEANALEAGTQSDARQIKARLHYTSQTKT